MYVGSQPNQTAREYSSCAAIPRDYKDPSDLNCVAPSSADDIPREDVSGLRNPGAEVTVPWIWCMFLILITPDIFLIIRSLKALKTEKKTHENGDSCCNGR